MMDYSVNAKRTFFGNEDDSTTDDEDQLLDEKNSSENPIYEPSVLYKTDAIRDRYKFAHITFCLLGILTLLPWNFFATANDYWMYKFRDVLSNNSHTNKTELQAEFTSYLSIASTGPSLFFLIVNIIYAHRISFQVRIIGSLIIILLTFILTTALVYVNTDKWQNIFFVVTLLSATVMNIFSGILQASVWGVASKFSSKYISAATSGQALGGIFAAIFYIVSLALSSSSTTSAMLYFIFAIVTVLAGLVFYKILSLSKFFKYHLLQKTPARALKYDPAEVNETCSAFEPPNVSVVTVLSKIWSYGFSVGLCFTVTLSVYPSVTVLIGCVNPKGDWGVFDVCQEPQEFSGTGSQYRRCHQVSLANYNLVLWKEKYFVPVIAFLLFSTWDYIGRVLAGYLKWPLHMERLIIGFSFIRVVFVPLILLCNAHPREYLPVLIQNDSYYIVITCLFGFTNGYLTNITMINYRSAVDDTEKDVASSVMAVFLALGCAAGSALSFLMLNIL